MNSIYISHDKKNPKRYMCDNFIKCGVSSTHDPEYVGWYAINGHGFACSKTCRSEIEIKRALR